MPFTYPVDPAKIHTIPDMNIAYALTSTLVEWDDEKELSAGLAESWKVTSPNVYRLTLRSNAQWSNGEAILCSDIKKSFERSLRAHPVDMRGLSLTLSAIECPSSREVDFRLKLPARNSGLLRRMTEPKFGIVKIGPGDRPDLSVSSGPFSLLSRSNESQLTLIRNPKWIRTETEIPNIDRIAIRRMPRDMDAQTVLLTDRWPNFIETLSLSSPDLARKYEKRGFEIWKAPLDKVFYLQLGKRSANPEGRGLLRFLRANLNQEALLKGMTGYSIASQLFPRGYELHDPSFSCPRITHAGLPTKYRAKPIEILVSPARVSLILKENLRRILKQTTGLEPHFISVPLEDVPNYRTQGNFDLYAGSVGISEPDSDTLLSFYLEGDMPLIYSTGTQKIHLAVARKTEDSNLKMAMMREILRDALCEGHILPLFHLSSVGLGTKDLDFSQVSGADESVRLSKLRFRTPSTVLAGETR